MGKKPKSAFESNGLKDTLEQLQEEIRVLYQADSIPWVVGYSGGKDSTAVLQLVWNALADLPPSELTKPVHVISTDTLVENPIVAAWVSQSLERMQAAATAQGLPITPHRLTPKVSDSFWVNLIGRGYPAPRPKFRWCTDRLKIQPSNDFINNVVKERGEAILVLGTRKAESAVRAKVMEKFEARRIRDKLSPNGSLPNSLVYTPIETWSNDDVWMYLMQVKNPWGYRNKDLLTMYQGASEDGECPLVVDSTTPSCGDSRFGCWVCTMVDQDKSMTAMIQNDAEKEWMLPLLELRNALDYRQMDETTGDRHLRDFRRMSGLVQIFVPKNGEARPIPGPYKQEVRADWLKRVLEAQRWVRENGPDEVSKINLITIPELEEIRRIWLTEKHEIEDLLPGVYEESTGDQYPGDPLDDHQVFGANEMAILKDLCEDDDLHYQLSRELLDIERSYRSMARRAGLFDRIEVAFRRSFYEGEEDASERAVARSNFNKKIAESREKIDQGLLDKDDRQALLPFFNNE